MGARRAHKPALCATVPYCTGTVSTQALSYYLLLHGPPSRPCGGGRPAAQYTVKFIQLCAPCSPLLYQCGRHFKLLSIVNVGADGDRFELLRTLWIVSERANDVLDAERIAANLVCLIHRWRELCVPRYTVSSLASQGAVMSP